MPKIKLNIEESLREELRLKAVNTKQSRSDSVNGALVSSLYEDIEDIKSWIERKYKEDY